MKHIPTLKEVYMLSEAAANVKHLLDEDAAVFIDNSGSTTSIFVYNWKEVLKAMSEQIGSSPVLTNIAIQNTATKTAYAWIQLSAGHDKFKDVVSVMKSVARKGYGPVVYDMALASSYPNWVEPDQEHLSADAKKVWSFIYHNRSNEIEHKSIKGHGKGNKGSDIEEPNPARNIYRLRGPNKSPMLDALKANHQKFLAQVHELAKKYPEASEKLKLDKIEVKLKMAAESFFTSKYHGWLNEAALGPEQISAGGRKMALIISKTANFTSACLFDADLLLQLLEKDARENKVDPRTGYTSFGSVKAFFQQARRKYTKAFAGFIMLEAPFSPKVCDADTAVINLAAAEKGHGPFMYDLIISSAYPKFVVSDRISVSMKAAKVWTYYYKNRKGDVEIQPIQHLKCQNVPMLNGSRLEDADQSFESYQVAVWDEYPEEAAALSHKYRMAPRSSPYLKKMLANGDVFKKRAAQILSSEIRATESDPNPGKRFVEEILQRHKSLDDFLDFFLLEMGNLYFGEKYNSSEDRSYE